MEVLKYNSNGMPLYWIITDKSDPWFMKVVKRLDKNSSGLCSTYPKYLESKVREIRIKSIK